MPRLLQLLDRLIDTGLIAVLVFTPVAFGGVEEWARALGQAMIWVVFAAWVCRSIWTPPLPAGRIPAGSLFRGRVRLSGLELPAVLFVVVLLLQLVPLPPRLIDVVSPRTHEIYSQTLPGHAQKSETFAGMPRWLQGDPEPNAGSVEGFPPAPDIVERAFPGEWFDVPRGAWRPLSLTPSDTRRALSVFLAHLALFVVAFHRLDRRDGRSAPIVTLAVLGGVLAVVGILQYLTADGTIYWFRTGGPQFGFGPFVNANHYACWMAMVLPLTAALTLTGWFRTPHERRERPFPAAAVLFGFATVIGLAAFALAQSRGGFLALTVAVALGFALHGLRARLSWRVLALGLVPLVLAFAMVVWIDAPAVTERYGTLADVAEDRSFKTRLDYTERALRMARDFPVLGSGLGTFREAYYLYTPGTSSQELAHAHNDYAQLAAECGALGLVPMLWALVVIVRRGVVRVLGRRSHPSTWVAMATAVGVLALLFHSFVDFNLQIYANSLLFVFICALLMREAAEDTADEGRP